MSNNTTYLSESHLLMINSDHIISYHCAHQPHHESQPAEVHVRRASRAWATPDLVGACPTKWAHQLGSVIEFHGSIALLINWYTTGVWLIVKITTFFLKV